MRVLKEDNATLLAKVKALGVAAYDRIDPTTQEEYLAVAFGLEMKKYNKEVMDLQIEKSALHTQAAK
jgi:hypothetical protein